MYTAASKCGMEPEYSLYLHDEVRFERVPSITERDSAYKIKIGREVAAHC